MRPFHVFIDESGNFHFSEKGSKFFVLTAVSTHCCEPLFGEYFNLKHSLSAEGLDLPEFHATEDRQVVRNQFFDILESHCDHCCFSTDAIVVQKNKTNPAIREETLFYARILKVLLQYVFERRVAEDVDVVIIWAAQIGTRKKRSIFEKTVKVHLKHHLDVSIPYRVLIHPSQSHPMLQVADYCCWAIARKWKDGDWRSYERIKTSVKTEFDVFEKGEVEYY